MHFTCDKIKLIHKKLELRSSWLMCLLYSQNIQHGLPLGEHTKFVTVAHTELWIFTFFIISQSEQICKWGIKYTHSVTTDNVGSTCVHHYPHTKFYKKSLIAFSLQKWRFSFLLTRNLHHPSIHTDSMTTKI